MAITVTNLTAGGTTGSATSATTASVSPTADALILLAVCYYDSADNPTFPTSITGNGLTWELVNYADVDQFPADFSRLWLYRAIGSSPSAGTIVISFGATSIGRISWVVDQFTGVAAGGNGTKAIVQSAVAAGASGATSLTAVLDPFEDAANNIAYGVFQVQTSNPATFTVGGSFTLTGKFDTSTSFAQIAAEYRAADADPSMSWSATSVFQSGAVAAEIAAAGRAGKVANLDFSAFPKPKMRGGDG